MAILIGALAIAAVFLVLYWFMQGYQPVRHRQLGPTRLYRIVEALYFRGFSDGTMTVTMPGRGELTVRKHILQDNDVRLRLAVAGGDLPATAATVAAELGIIPHLSGTPTYHDAQDRIEIDFGNALVLGEQFLRHFAKRAYGVDLLYEGYAELRNVAAQNVRIGWSP